MQSSSGCRTSTDGSSVPVEIFLARAALGTCWAAPFSVWMRAAGPTQSEEGREGESSWIGAGVKGGYGGVMEGLGGIEEMELEH